ncbi:Nucleolin 2 [Psilocybe cubensis]|uniref:Nucleolin 2 n=2 Tax=Psilocybe cubensis TaxID=181762 RepID=A0ACB8GP51_PSICU|nr:Nucleolin 2 [Psilocybe cubensis]KAH9476780.1 Nucleolin 2 [Psilocybe cubensis]
MFSALRQQARLSLRIASRAAVPASRTLSSLTLRQAVVAPALATRAFSSAKVWAYEREGERDNTPSPPSESLYVGNMPWDMTKEDLLELFSQFGQVVNVRIQTHADGRPRGFAHITFSTQEAATAAMNSSAAEPFHVAGRDLFLDYARQNRSLPPLAPNKKLYFPQYYEDEDSLRQLFSEFKDQITSIYFIRDGNTGEKTNAGFIEFTSTEVATEALDKLNKTPTGDNTFLSLSYSRPPRREARRMGRQDNQTPYTNRGYQPRARDY